MLMDFHNNGIQVHNNFVEEAVDFHNNDIQEVHIQGQGENGRLGFFVFVHDCVGYVELVLNFCKTFGNVCNLYYLNDSWM